MREWVIGAMQPTPPSHLSRCRQHNNDMMTSNNNDNKMVYNGDEGVRSMQRQQGPEEWHGERGSGIQRGGFRQRARAEWAGAAKLSRDNMSLISGGGMSKGGNERQRREQGQGRHEQM